MRSTLVEIARQDAVEFVDDVGLVGAVIEHRAFDPGAPPGPGLALLVARPHEHDELPSLWPGANSATDSGSANPVR